MSRKIILINILSLLVISAIAQEKTLQFSIHYAGKVTGSIMASHRYIDSNETYTITGEAVVNLWVAKSVLKNTQHSIYENDVLKYSRAENSKNGEVEKTMETCKRGNFYNVKSNGGNSNLHENIVFGVGRLYFQEPLGLKEIYSEAWGQMLLLSNKKNHSYTLHLPNGKESSYSYDDGELQTVQTETIVGNVYFIRTNSITEALVQNK